jgi:two-component system, LytTR family, response regulator
MRVLIVDDEPAARRRLQIMLEELDIEVAGEAANGLAALALVREHHPDVVLLDIAMREVDGFDVVRHLEDPKPLVIFQTAYDEHALRAFDVGAVDYVLKPVTLDRLQRALGSARERLEGRRGQSLSDDVLRQLRAELARHAPAPSRRLLVREGTGHRLVAFDDILCLRAANRLAIAVTAARSFPTHYQLHELEERTAGVFLRASRSELVNRTHIVGYQSEVDGSAVLMLSDRSRVRVSRRRAAEVRAALEG